ncbi:D-alanine--poly(phosphoribitol) ligase subunit 1 [Pseudovibrio sp. W64]|uniref:AMP-binding protein n=1 Tax=Pseudovibrio TaxID=258255 RepID=UPI0007AE3936|nr:AMP-binding protein [Pseudovibrio sp. W64]KZK81515.1 D-alanine--poly(phosphoribitol) ligase subunit 1 [Pseudovibrio sp. W64]
MKLATAPAPEPASICWEKLRKIFESFAGDTRPAYHHPTGTISFAELRDAVLKLLALEPQLHRTSEARPVLVWGHKDPRYLVAYWACLLSGRALVPIEPETPKARLQQIIEVCAPCAILFADHQVDLLELLREQFGSDDLPVISISSPSSEDAAYSTADLPGCEMDDSDIAYIMFSSGTLGAPKGIKVTYANLIDFIGWLDELLPDATSEKSVSGTIRYCFDVSLFEIWTSWSRKRPLVALDHAEIWDSSRYIARLADKKAELWVSTPSIVRLFLKNRRFCENALSRLKTFVFCGEPLTKSIVEGLLDRFPGCRVINTYGPTECTVAVTSVEITEEHLKSSSDLPIGQVRAGTSLYCAPDTPFGEPGEIWISGASVGAGYIGLPEKQARAFPKPDVYRSGDRGSCNADGVWSFLGRLDREIKIQGIRIDLNDVEAHLRRQDGVEDAVVEPYILHGEPRALSAFVLGPHSDKCLERLATAMATDLPIYLVPRYWFAGFESGLNLNSKLNRHQLAGAQKTARLRHLRMPGYLYTKTFE